jgi:hypothetical protein
VILAAGGNAGGGSTLGSLALAVALIALYWLPSFIAWRRHVQGIGQVVIVNFFAFFFLVPWVIALVMAFRHVPAGPGGPGQPEPSPPYGHVPPGA